MQTKTCSVCKKSLPVIKFSKDVSRNDGLYSRCRSCNALGNKITSPRGEIRGRAGIMRQMQVVKYGRDVVDVLETLSDDY